MPDTATASRHGLEAFLCERAPTSTASIAVSIVTGTGYLNLRVAPRDAAVAGRLAGVLGQRLPIDPNTLTTGEQVIFWLGPDEFLVRADAQRAQHLAGSLESRMQDGEVSSNDVGGGLCTLQLKGADVRALLAKGCTLDLHADRFSAGHCAQTGLARAGVLLACIDDPQAIDVVVRRSFADYLCRWLLHSGAEHGIRFDVVQSVP